MDRIKDRIRKTIQGAYKLVVPHVTCPHCQEKSLTGAKFCAHCGGKLSDTPGAQEQNK